MDQAPAAPVTETKIVMSDPTALGVFGLSMVTFVAASQVRNYFVHIAEPDNIKLLLASPDFANLQKLIIDGLLKMHTRPVIKRQVLSAVWGANHLEDTHYLRVYMGHLRRKIEADPSQPRHLVTETGIGYRFVP